MIISETRNGTCYARLDGEMTIYTAAECKQDLAGCLSSAEALEFDLSGVTEIDSAGVQLLILAKREGARKNMPVHLVSHSPAVQEIIDLYRLAPAFGDLMIMSPN